MLLSRPPLFGDYDVKLKGRPMRKDDDGFKMRKDDDGFKLDDDGFKDGEDGHHDGEDGGLLI